MRAIGAGLEEAWKIFWAPSFSPGAVDVAPGPATIKAQAARGRPHIVPECGHHVPLERPAALRSILGEVIADLAGTRIPYKEDFQS